MTKSGHDRGGNRTFGAFADAGRRFVISTPDTPVPWVNVISNGRYGLTISQAGGGFSFLDHCQLNVLTRWEMDLVRDRHGKFLYLVDLDALGSDDASRSDQAIWSLAPAPCRPAYDRFECEHAPGVTRFRSWYAGIEACWSVTVSPTDPVEVWWVEVRNTTDRSRRLRLCSYLEWCCGVAPDSKREFHRLFFDVTYDPVRRAVFATKNMWDVPPQHEREHWNVEWPSVAAHALLTDPSVAPSVTLGDKASFIGRSGSDAAPVALGSDRATSGGFGRFGDAAGALGTDLALAPGESSGVGFLIVAESDRDAAKSLIDHYRMAGVAAQTVDDAEAAWRDRLEPVSMSSSCEDIDAMCGTWLPYQAISGRLWARTGYYQQSGAFGFRDQLQDSLVWLPIDPSRCRSQILLHAAHQFSDGRVYHWWNPLTETGLETTCSDDYLWLAFVTAAYVRETDDLGILECPVPFVDDRDGASLLEHCERSIERAFHRMSARGLPLLGSCDWNDGLSAAGIEQRGESVWLAFFLMSILRDFDRLYRRIGRDDAAARCVARREQLFDAVNAHAWDGAWFRRATTDDGRWLGAADCAEGRIFLNPQVWCILSDGTTPERMAAAWDSVKEHLLKPMGPLLLAPAFTTPDASIGYITRYAPGARENGGVYMHAATWALAAACTLKDAETARRIWMSISPPRRSSVDQAAYRAEPYVTPGDVDGPDSELPGRAGWTWYTGSAAWLHRVVLEGLMGTRATWDGLEIDPCPFAELGEVRFSRRYRGSEVRVRFDAGEFRSGSSARLDVGGIRQAGTLISPDVVGPGPVEVGIRWGQQEAAMETTSS